MNMLTTPQQSQHPHQHQTTAIKKAAPLRKKAALHNYAESIHIDQRERVYPYSQLTTTSPPGYSLPVPTAVGAGIETPQTRRNSATIDGVFLRSLYFHPVLAGRIGTFGWSLPVCDSLNLYGLPSNSRLRPVEGSSSSYTETAPMHTATKPIRITADITISPSFCNALVFDDPDALAHYLDGLLSGCLLNRDSGITIDRITAQPRTARSES